MNSTIPQSAIFRRFAAPVLVFFATLLVLFVVFFFFPWDVLRQPINHYVSEQLGRQFEITRRLSVNLGTTITVSLDGLEIANPDWANEPYLVKAKAADFDIRLWPLLFGKIDLPRLVLTEPQIGLQLEPDGRRSWVLSRDTADVSAAPSIGTLSVNEGSLKYRASESGVDVTALFSTAEQDAALLPLRFQVSGKLKNETFTASGRTGGVLALSRDVKGLFPLEVSAQSGKTNLKVKGSIENIFDFAGLQMSFDMQGRNLDELFKFSGVVLPSTPPYKLRGQLSKQGNVWSASQMTGTLGNSDISGALAFDTSNSTPLLTGKVQSKVLDFKDLAPVIGLPLTSTSATKKSVPTEVAKAVPTLSGAKVIPTAKLDFQRLKSMNADVIYSALDVRNVDQLPLEKGSVHVKLNNGILQLNPLAISVAGGLLVGSMTIDVNVVPAAFKTLFDLRNVQLNRLFPSIQNTKSSLGKISGKIDLQGRGNSMAQMLGSANGDVAVLMGKGEISNILMEFLGLDGGEVIKFFLRGDRNIQLRCAAAAFEVKQGLMRSKVIVLDTSDTVINGTGQISLASETLELTLKPEPKDKSILSLRSPLKIGGTFAAPTAGPDKTALAGRAGLAIALGIVNPLLALLATIETGPGQDANCTGALAIAANPKSAASAKPGVQ